MHAIKYYPAGATTNSESGVTALERAYPALAAMERARDGRSSLHGEVTDPDVDMFDRERVFIDRHLARLVRDFPALRIVVEHVTTREAVAVRRATRRQRRRDDHAAAPALVAQRAVRRRAAAALLLPAGAEARGASRGARRRRDVGQPEVLPRHRLGAACAHVKEARCCGAGCYSAPLALELYAEVFDDAGALDRLEGFASVHGAALLRAAAATTDTVTLVARAVDGAASTIRSATTPSCRCAPARRCAGASCTSREAPRNSARGAILASEASQTVAARAQARGEESPGSTEQDAG